MGMAVRELYTPEKLRGGYYTPVDLATWICDWAVDESTTTVLEPSCGDGVFIAAAINRHKALKGASQRKAFKLTAVEIQPAEARKAQQLADNLSSGRISTTVFAEDFFDWSASTENELFDVVVGNPPFIRFQLFPEPSRSKAMELLRLSGMVPNRLTNAWVPFVVGATRKIKPEGRLALVLPAELLQVSYAKQLRKYLLDNFSAVTIITFNQMLFTAAEQETVVLLCSGKRQCINENEPCRIAALELTSLKIQASDILDEQDTSRYAKIIHHDTEKWLKYFLSAKEIEFMRELRCSHEIACFSHHGSVDVGVVTGNNAFFLVDGAQVERHSLESYTARIAARSSHLKGVQFTADDWFELAGKGDKVFLLALATEPNHADSQGVLEYIKRGEKEKVAGGYKCSIRKLWYCVPSIWIPDAFMYRQIHDFPNLLLNKSGAVSTDTIHRVRLKSNTELVVTSYYTYLTAASSEIEGRSYGGGVHELEPTEAERLLIPRNLYQGLGLSELDSLARRGCLREALDLNSEVVLRLGLGLTRGECAMLRGIWEKLRDRRQSRKQRAST